VLRALGLWKQAEKARGEDTAFHWNFTRPCFQG